MSKVPSTTPGMIESNDTSLYSKVTPSFCATASARSTVQPANSPFSSWYSFGWYSGLIATERVSPIPSGSNATAAGSASTTIFSSRRGVSAPVHPVSSSAETAKAATSPCLIRITVPRKFAVVYEEPKATDARKGLLCRLLGGRFGVQNVPFPKTALLCGAYCRLRVGFVRRVRRFEEVDQLERVVGGGHPLGRVRLLVVRFEAQLFQSPVSQVLDVLADVTGVESEDAAGQQVAVVLLFHLDGVQDHLADLVGELRRLQFGVLVEHREDQVDTELEVQALIAYHPVHEGAEVAQQVPLAERQRHHEARVEPDAFQHDVVGDQVADEVLLSFHRGDVEGLLGHPLDEPDLELFLAHHRRNVDVGGVGGHPVNRECLEDVLERHRVVRLFPHLLGQVHVCLGRVDIGVHAEGQRLVDQQLVGVEVTHQEGDGVTLFIQIG